MKTFSASPTVGDPTADQRAAERATLYGGGDKPQLPIARVIFGLDEDEDERDRVQVPRLDQDGGDHHPPAAVAGNGPGLVQKYFGRLVRHPSDSGLVHDW